MNEPNSFGNPEFLEYLKRINDHQSMTSLGQNQTESQSRSDVNDLAKPLAAHGVGAASADPAPDLVPPGKSLSSESDSRLPRRERKSRINDIWTSILVALVIGTAMGLGALVGWRLGWQKASLGLRASSPTHRANAPSKTGQTDQAVYAARELQLSTASAKECDQAAAAGTPAKPPSAGLTICQDGRVIFRLPHSALSPIRGLQTSQRSPGLEGDPTRR